MILFPVVIILFPGDETEAVSSLQQLAGQLPRYHYNTLGFLCQHLSRVAQHSETNNMPASNLAIGKRNNIMISNGLFSVKFHTLSEKKSVKGS